MKRLNNQKGITLVALVVTIIILLILAGITITELTNSGLFQKAQIARKNVEVTQKEEEIELNNYENEIEEYLSSTRNTSSYSVIKIGEVTRKRRD